MKTFGGKILLVLAAAVTVVALGGASAYARDRDRVVVSDGWRHHNVVVVRDRWRPEFRFERRPVVVYEPYPVVRYGCAYPAYRPCYGAYLYARPRHGFSIGFSFSR